MSNNKIFLIPPSYPLYHCCHSFHLHISTCTHTHTQTQTHTTQHQIHCCCKYFEQTYYYLLNQLRIGKIHFFILPSFFHSLLLFLSLCKPECLTYIIFLLSRELLTFLAEHVYWQKIFSIFVCLRRMRAVFSHSHC